MSRSTILLLFSVIIGAQSNPTPEFTTCKKDDYVCQTKTANTLFKLGIAGDPERNIERLDPMYQDKIIADLGVLKFQLRNSTVEGLKDCVVTNSKIDLEHLKVYSNLDCPYVYMYGLYQVSGKLLTKSIQGDGHYTVKLKGYKILLDIDIKFTQAKDKKRYVSLKSFTVTGDLKGGMIIDATNLFNGQKELADNMLKFINKNWKLVIDVIQEPVLRANFKRLITNVDKNILKNIPFNKFIQE